MSASAAPRLQILAAALLFSTGGAVVKAVSLTGWQIAAGRSLIAALALALFMPSWRRGWTYRTFAVGLTYAATMVLFVLGNRLTTAANLIFLQATAPLYLVVVGPLLLREKISRREIGVALTIAVGMALILFGIDPPQDTAPNPRLGNILGAIAGLSWALTLTGLRWLGRTPADVAASPSGAPAGDPTGGAVIVGNLVAGFVCLPLALPLAGTVASDWTLVAYLGLFQIGVAYVCMTRGVRRVPVFEASLLLLLEPVASVFWAWMVHGERPAGWATAGCAVILTATALNVVAPRRRE
jgi:drug/metabolite transporter (DMT)-like permease